MLPWTSVTVPQFSYRRVKHVLTSLGKKKKAVYVMKNKAVFVDTSAIGKMKKLVILTSKRELHNDLSME